MNEQELLDEDGCVLDVTQAPMIPMAPKRAYEKPTVTELVDFTAEDFAAIGDDAHVPTS